MNRDEVLAPARSCLRRQALICAETLRVRSQRVQTPTLFITGELGPEDKTSGALTVSSAGCVSSAKEELSRCGRETPPPSAGRGRWPGRVDVAEGRHSVSCTVRHPGDCLGRVFERLTFFGLAILEVSTEVIFAFVAPVLAAHAETRFLLRDQNGLGQGFAIYFFPSIIGTLLGFVSFGIATFRARVYPRWTGVLIAIGEVVTIVMDPLKSVPSGPFRLDRLGILATALGFAWCGWRLLRQATAPRASTAVLTTQ